MNDENKTNSPRACETQPQAETATVPTPTEPISVAQPAAESPLSSIEPPTAVTTQPNLTPPAVSNKRHRWGMLTVIIGVILLIVGGVGAYGYNAHTSRLDQQVKARDIRRQADIVTLKKALDVYYANSPDGNYPSTLAGLTQGQDPIMPKLPAQVGKAPYWYSYKPTPVGCQVTCQGFTLNARVENPTATGPYIANGVYAIDNNYNY